MSLKWCFVPIQSHFHSPRYLAHELLPVMKSVIHIDPERRRNARHIAIIFVVDLVLIQRHFQSSSSSASNMLTMATVPSTLSRAIPRR